MLSIVIPAHNEALRIGQTLQQYNDYFSTRLGSSFEIIVVTNGCIDSTEDIVHQYSTSYDQVKIHQIAGKGKGLAIRAGMKIAQGDLVAFTDADGATKPYEADKPFFYPATYCW